MKKLIVIPIILMSLTSMCQNTISDVIFDCDSTLMKVLERKCRDMHRNIKDESAIKYRCQEYAKFNGACVVYRRKIYLNDSGIPVDTLYWIVR